MPTGEVLTEQIDEFVRQERRARALAEAEALAQAALLTPVDLPVVENSASLEVEQVITHQHDDGVVRSVESIDALRGGVCPAMEGLSHKQVMLAMKMAARGRERMAKQAEEKAAHIGSQSSSKQQEAKTVLVKVAYQQTHVRNNEQTAKVLRDRELTQIVTEQIVCHAEDKTQASAQENIVALKPRNIDIPLPDKPAKVIDIKTRQVRTTDTPKPRALDEAIATSHKVQKVSQPKIEISKVPEPPRVSRQVLAAVPDRLKNPNSQTANPVSNKPALRLVPGVAMGSKPIKPKIIAEAPPVPRLRLFTEAKVEATKDRHKIVDIEAKISPVVEQNQEFEATTAQEPEAITPQPIELDVKKDNSQAAVEQVADSTAVSNETAEQATTLLIKMPEQVQASLKEFVDNSEPEVVEAVEAQIVMISKVAERLHSLALNNEGQSKEAVQIEQWLTQQYTELLNTLGAPCDEETIAAFIKLVKSSEYAIKQEFSSGQEPYDPMRERHGWSDLRGRQTASNFTTLLRAELARFAVHHGLAA